MFIELIATFAAGFAAAGVVLILNMLSRGRLPRWVMPLAAGAAMLAMAVTNEYAWASRTEAGLPEGVVVIARANETRWYRPWTYVVPQTVRMVALDTVNRRTRTDLPGVTLVDLYLLARWQPPARVGQLLRCAEGRQADATADAISDPAGAIWRDADPAVLAAACGD